MMKQMVVDIVGGARPNFIKLAALFRAGKNFPRLQLRLIHTGQHYDKNMSDIFLKQLGLPKPYLMMSTQASNRWDQIAQIAQSYENHLKVNRPQMTIVVGDVNSTVACSMTANQAQVPLAHVEAGLRSFDRTMPEEVNRIITDRLSDLHFVTEPSGVDNLRYEGVSQKSIHLVGNVMIDTLRHFLPQAQKLNIYRRFGVESQQYGLVTLHRPSNVDDSRVLQSILSELSKVSQRLPLIFPVHPRTQKSIEKIKVLKNSANIVFTEPLGYLESMSLMSSSKLMITDSGGMQEETSALNIPCLTLRHNTERPITLDVGSSVLIKDDWRYLHACVSMILDGKWKEAMKIKLWDGHAAKRILTVCQKYLTKR